MAKRPRDDSRQVNITLERADAEVLAALSFLNASSAAEVVRPAVERFLREQREDAEVQAALEIRAGRNRTSAT